MCLITCNALERVSHRLISSSELVHFNFHPDSDLVFLFFFLGGGGGGFYLQVEVLLSLDETVTRCVDRKQSVKKVEKISQNQPALANASRRFRSARRLH